MHIRNLKRTKKIKWQLFYEKFDFGNFNGMKTRMNIHEQVKYNGKEPF